MKCIALLPFVLLPLGSDSTAQQRSPEPVPPVKVMILGTYHFASPGLDVVKTGVADVMTPEKQAEIAEVVEALSGFRPTKIAIEASGAAAVKFDRVYAAYRAGEHELTRNERQQLGFRLAARFDHQKVYPIDHGGDFPLEEVMAYAQEHDPAFVQEFMKMVATIEAEEDSLQRHATVREILRHHNDPRFIAGGHSQYVNMARVGAGDSYVGANLLAAWYDRNIRIFANLTQIGEPGDRILVIFGSGHSAVLRHFVESSEQMELVDPLDFL
ncbi:MAG: hypothetical protein IH851_01305 [Armatimonadetes bacterium]|nr:hypothetical protein [Armatimonadota bacterium]